MSGFNRYGYLKAATDICKMNIQDIQYFKFDRTSHETNQCTTDVFNHREFFNQWLNTVQTKTSDI